MASGPGTDLDSNHSSGGVTGTPFQPLAIRRHGTPDSTAGMDDNGSVSGQSVSSTHTGSRRAPPSVASSVHSFPMVTRELPEESVTVFKEKPSRNLFCMLCQNVYKDPVITTCGHTFCRKCCLPSSRGTKPKCPVDECELQIVVVNLAVAEQVGELLIHCKYGTQPVADRPGEYEVKPDGCPKTVKLLHRREHEHNCDFQPLRCPNSDMCPPLLRREMEDHLKTCNHIRCPHARYNCPFFGTRNEVDDHIRNCRFEALKGFLGETDEKIQKLQRQVKQKDDEISFLRTSLASVSERLSMLEKNYEFRMERLERENKQLGADVTEMRHRVISLTNDLQGYAVQVNDPHNFRLIGSFIGHEGPVWSLCAHNNLLLSGSSDNTIKVWGPMQQVWDQQSAGRCLRTLAGHTGVVLALATSGSYLYSGAADNTIRVWKLDTYAPESTLHAHDNPVCTLATSRNYLFSGSLKTIKVWSTRNPANLELVQEITAQNHWVRALVATDSELYAGSYESIKIWMLDTFHLINTVEVTGGSVYSLVVTPAHLICGTYENNIFVWDRNSLDVVPHKLVGHTGTVYALRVISTNSRLRLFSASNDKSVRVWSLDAMQCVQTMQRHEGSVSCLATIQGRLFTGAVDNTIKVWQ